MLSAPLPSASWSGASAAVSGGAGPASSAVEAAAACPGVTSSSVPPQSLLGQSRALPSSSKRDPWTRCCNALYATATFFLQAASTSASHVT
eukprot:1489402-Rhodomonas_salina.1